MKKVGVFGLLALLAMALVFPLVIPDPTIASMAVFTLLFAAAATGWNIFSGYTGYISLGHASFYGLGAYTLALACRVWHVPGGYLPFLFFPLAGLVAGVGAIPLGWIALSTRRHVFVVVTIALLFILQLLAYNLKPLTNGSAGLYLPNPPWSEDIFYLPFYYVALFLALLALGVSWWVRHSKFGLGLLAIRDDEDRALSLGVKTEVYKLGAYILSAVITGMAGAFYAYFTGVVYPQFTFDPVYDISVALMTFLGGFGTLLGPIIGALLLEPAQQYITIQFGSNGMDLVLYGGLFLIIIYLLPDGIVPTLRRRWTMWTESRSNVKLVSAVTTTVEQDSARTH
jgi:branched-chain amino acid transport system permease protein